MPGRALRREAEAVTRLSNDRVNLFYKLHPALTLFANDRPKVVPDKVADPQEYACLPPETLELQVHIYPAERDDDI